MGVVPQAATVTDVDGNVYPTVTVGTQVWMAENLKVAHYRNGDEIPDGAGVSAQDPGTVGFSSAYEDDPANVEDYGKLYSWQAQNDSRGICPEGFHVPSQDEWMALINFLGGDSVAGGKMKETGDSHWPAPNADATDEFGFRAIPGGVRDQDGTFHFLGDTAYFWTSTERGDVDASYYVTFSAGIPEAPMGAYPKGIAMSVRCMGDAE